VMEVNSSGSEVEELPMSRSVANDKGEVILILCRGIQVPIIYCS
jgi:hypothetical protein